MNASRVILVLILIAAGAGAGFFFGRHFGGEEKEKNESPEAASTQDSDDEHAVATITVAPVRMGQIVETIKAYGSVIADPAEVRVISVPFESRVGRVMTTPGQEISTDTELLQIEASPDTAVALQDARNVYESAQKDLEQTQQRFNDKLATNQELSAAQQTAKAAKLKLDSMVERGVGKQQHLTSPVAGMVSKLDVQEGQIVPAGGPLIEIAAERRFQVKLGVEPTDVPALEVGQPVHLRRIDQSSDEAIEGKVRLIGKRVDPTTRLVDVFVSLPPNTPLLLDTFVVGELKRESKPGLIVPREAIVLEEDGQVIFTVKDKHATKHAVHPGIEDRHDVQISADDVKEGDEVALAGSFVLEDGMEVEVKESESKPEEQTSQPSTKKVSAEAFSAPFAIYRTLREDRFFGGADMFVCLGCRYFDIRKTRLDGYIEPRQTQMSAPPKAFQRPVGTRMRWISRPSTGASP
jgi:RND family efflux transporter MFP subunit